MMQRVVIIASQRSGTHALGSVLSNNGFVNFDEVFLPTWGKAEPETSGRLLRYLEKDPKFMLEYIKSPEKIFDSYIEHLDGLANGNYYIDIKYNMLQHFSGPYFDVVERPNIVKLLSKSGFKIIHLFRANSFKRYFSERMGHATAQFHVPVGTPEADIAKPTFSIQVDRCLKVVELHQQAVKLTTNWLTGVPNVLTIQYENLFSGDEISEAGAERLREGLGITMETRRTSLMKPTRRMRDVVSNYDEVAEALTARGYGYMVTE